MGRRADVVLHVGYPKTASTWLQRHFFPGHPALHVPFGYRDLRRSVIWPHPREFDAASWHDEHGAALTAARDAADAGGGRGAVVLSNEHFVGFPGGRGQDTLENARRLHALFPDAKVWIVVREQVDLIRSLYSQSVRSGATAPLRRYLEPLPGVAPLAGYLDYDWLASHYESLFGKANVHVSAFEAFRDDTARFLADFCRFAGVAEWSPDRDRQTRRENPGLSPSALSILRMGNTVLAPQETGRHRMVRLPGRYAFMRVLAGYDRAGGRRLAPDRHRDRIEDWAGDRFRDSNRRLATRLGVDLAAWGYRA